MGGFNQSLKYLPSSKLIFEWMWFIRKTRMVNITQWQDQRRLFGGGMKLMDIYGASIRISYYNQKVTMLIPKNLDLEKNKATFVNYKSRRLVCKVTLIFLN